MLYVEICYIGDGYGFEDLGVVLEWVFKDMWDVYEDWVRNNIVLVYIIRLI